MKSEKINKTALFFILTHWIGGGTEKVFLNIASCFAKNEAYDIFLFIIKKNEKDSKFKIPYNVSEIEKFENFKKKQKLYKNSFIINFSGDWLSSSYARLCSRKYISWVHINPDVMKTARTWFINKKNLLHSEKIVCVCKEQKEILENEFYFPSKKIIVIYNSVDFGDIEQKSKELIPLVDRNYFLMVARLFLAQKDFFTLIDAYNLLPEKLKASHKLVLLGNGPDSEKIKKYVQEKKLEDKIVFSGFDSNPYRWIANSCCSILSSKYEGFSMTTIETMVLKVPLVITEYHTGASEVCENGKNCFMVNIGDAPAMSKAMENAVTDKTLTDRMLENSSEFIKKFGSKEFYKNVLSLFEKGAIL